MRAKIKIQKESVNGLVVYKVSYKGTLLDIFTTEGFAMAFIRSIGG